KEPGGKPVNMDDILVEVAGPNTMPEFTENLRGANAGDQRTFDVHYPDDFAKELGEFDSFDELKTRVRESLLSDKQRTAEREAKDKLMDELVKRNPFPVPDALIERQIDLRLERGLRALAAQGMRAEDMKKMDLARLRAGQRDNALQDVKAALILDRIADAEKIEVEEEEVNKEIEALATQSKQTAEAIRARLTRDGALDRIRNRIRNEKTLNFLYQQSA